jgi:SAM-dependent methyltransferase
VKDKLYRLTHPGVPRLTPNAITYLDNWLDSSCVGVEWGAGRSTKWLAQRVNKLVSVEHDPVWHKRVARDLREMTRRNVDIVLADPATPDYVGAVECFGDGELDFAIVDGVISTRDVCAKAALKKLKPGGVLVIDDTQRYRPSRSRAPESIGIYGSPPSEVWEEVLGELISWGCVETTDGLRDTVIWKRPKLELPTMPPPLNTPIFDDGEE